MHEVIAAALIASAPSQAKVLIVGVGDGEDLLALADLSALDVPAGAYRAWMAGAGVSTAMLDAAEQRMAREFHPITEARLAALLAQADLGPPVRLFQALGYGAYLSIKRG